MFSLQIANEQVEFSAAGFFPINYTLVFSVRFYIFIINLLKFFIIFRLLEVLLHT